MYRLVPNGPTEKRKQLSAEIDNGRLVMKAIMDRFFQDGMTASFEGILGVGVCMSRNPGKAAWQATYDHFSSTADADLWSFKRRRSKSMS